jgi:outer membrane receptor protein involved in Fe transport
MTIGGFVAATLANAQETASGVGLEEIVVTAQKREERCRTCPIQVNVFSEQNVADAGIGSTQDFVGYVPNMTFDRADTYRNSFVMIRGLTQITNADSPLAVVIDGVPQNDQKQFNMRLFDIERIEVLKGPQGTLYGRNAIGGAVNIVHACADPGPQRLYGSVVWQWLGAAGDGRHLGSARQRQAVVPAVGGLPDRRWPHRQRLPRRPVRLRRL